MGREDRYSGDMMKVAVGHISLKAYYRQEAGRWVGSWKEKHGHHLCAKA
jgi:hypothetical protein